MPLLDTQIQKRIDQKLEKLNNLHPLSSSAIKKIREQFQIEMTYNSNGIEGNSLTLKETFWVINEGITIKGKPLKDHLEAKDHYEALEYIYELIDSSKKPTISELLIRETHKLVMKKTDEEWAGRYRNSNVIIGGADHTPPDASIIPIKMKELIDWYKKNVKKLHPIELGSLIHFKIANIHPFFDGNGRTSRLLMNIVFMREGYPLSVVLKNDRKKYYRLLDQADKKEVNPFVTFCAQTVERSLDIYLNTLTPTSKEREKFQLLSEISKNVPYSAKYLNLLARQGRIEAHKRKRNWISSIEAIERYIVSRKRQRKL